MPLTLYKSNEKVAGSLVSWSFDSRTLDQEGNKKDPSFYCRIVKQVSWNKTKRIGSFSGGDSLAIKFTLFEIGKILKCLRNKESVSFSIHLKGVIQKLILGRIIFRAEKRKLLFLYYKRKIQMTKCSKQISRWTRL